MSTGSGHSGGPRGSRTDPRPRDSQRSRSQLYRSNLSDEHVNTTGLDDRPNNWDFSDWRPSDVFDNKRIKKENPEKERDKAKEKSLKQDSPPDGVRRKHTPSTYPRTKVSAATPVAERRSLERLRQQLQFGDQDEIGNQTGNERNNERLTTSSYERQLNFTDQLTASPTSGSANKALGLSNGLLRQAQEGARRIEQNNVRSPQGARAQTQSSQMPDSNQLVTRLMQVRDYIKQAMQMMERLRLTSASDQESRTKMRKLSQVIEQLREQEQNYMDFLMKVLSSEEAALIDAESSKDGTEEAGDDTTSVDMDAQSEISEATTESNQVARQDQGFLESRNRELEELSEDQRRIHDIIAGEAQAAMTEKQGELDQLKNQRDLLRNMLEQQRQLRDLQGRQVALLQQQRDSHQEIHQAKEAETEFGAVGESDMDDTQSVDSDSLARQLTDLKAQLDYAKNMYTTKQPDKSGETKSRDEGDFASDAASTSSVEQQQTQLLDKLSHLQGEKDRMDDLLKELKTMRDTKYLQLNNELEATSDQVPSPASNVASRQMARQALQSADGTVLDTNEILELLDERDEVKKLEEVRNRLTQLKDMVQYYESGTRFIHDEDGDEDDTELPPAMPNLDAMRDDVELHREALNQLKSSGALEPPQSIVQPRMSEDDSSDINFSLGPFEDDPEIMAQVNKLRTAKQRLKHLKQMVENMPSADEASAMLDEASELNASLGVSERLGSELQALARDEEQDQESEEYRHKVEEQKEELRNLMKERKKLMGVQEELRKLYENIPVPERVSVAEAGDASASQATVRNMTSSSRNKNGRKVVQRESVTFQDPPEVATNEEVYDRMRSQRILREELRSRKRELEAIMRKGDLRKPYSKLNQDNQSDNVSYSNKSDSFGFGNFSTDVTTMATWGGSSEQNLEEVKNSTHSNSTSTSDNEDDGYPSDGILQVEEEEEEQDSDAHTYTVGEDDEDDDDDDDENDDDDDDDEGDLVAKTNVQPPIIDVRAQQKLSLSETAMKNELLFKPRYNAWGTDTYPKTSVSRKKKKVPTATLR